MHKVSDIIFCDWQVRKTAEQKAAFRALLRKALEAEGHTVTEEKSKYMGSVNLVVGDVDTAQVVFGAHYDTCAVMPWPNMIAPKNLVMTMLCQMPIVIALFGVSFLLSFGMSLLTDNSTLVWLVDVVAFVGMLALLLVGPANKHTANDNTSGVLTLVEAILTMPEKDRKNAAFVFFDNEEKGLLGSGFFAKKHPKVKVKKLLINLDCVSDGDHFMLVYPAKTMKKDERTRQRLQDALVLPQGKTCELVSTDAAYYPSDQRHFAKGVGVAAFTKRRGIGYCMGRIHTKRDTQFDHVNIETLRGFILRLAASPIQSSPSAVQSPGRS